MTVREGTGLLVGSDAVGITGVMTVALGVFRQLVVIRWFLLGSGRGRQESYQEPSLFWGYLFTVRGDV